MGTTKITDDYFKKRFPYTSRYHHSPEALAKIKQRFLWWYIVKMLLLLVFVAMTTLLMGPLLSYIYIHTLQYIGGVANHLFLLSPQTFYIPVFLTATAVASVFTELSVKVLWDKQYDELTDYESAKDGYDGRKSNKHFCRIMLVVSCIIFLAFGSSFISYNNATFTVKHFYSAYPQTYKVAAVLKIKRVPHFNRKNHQTVIEYHYLISLSNTKQINTLHWQENEYTITSFINGLASITQPVDTTDEYLK